MKEIFNSVGMQTVVVLYGGEGTYNFAVRIYNPTLNKYFVIQAISIESMDEKERRGSISGFVLFHW